MTDLTLTAETRTEFGKGAARKIRRDHKIPAVMYGHGTAPVHIALPGHETMLALKHTNALLTLVIDGEEHLALAKDVQRDPIKPVIEHVDLVIVRKGEKVTVDIPVHLTGDPTPDALIVTETSVISVEAEATHIPEYVEVSIEGLAVGDQVLAKDLQVPSGSTVLLEVEATHIPENVVVSVEGLEAGTQVLAGQLELPAGAELVMDAETLVVNVTQQVSAEALEAELAEAEAEAGIEHEAPAEETEAPAAEASGEAAEQE